MRCDEENERRCGYVEMFQSLLGFLMRCDLIVAAGAINPLVQFQSLLGFLMRCDHPIVYVFTLTTFVSIPVGFSDALRRQSAEPCMPADRFQSLLGFLMRCDHILSEAGILACQFQSLLGFLMRCDQTSNEEGGALQRFQSLLGFLMRCDYHSHLDSLYPPPVSIPVGFSDALRPTTMGNAEAVARCFNPCWVF